MKTTCPHCSKEIEVNVKETDQYGFVVNSKGSFIADAIAKAGAKGTKLVDLIIATDVKYPGKNNVGRIQSVVNKMKKAGMINDAEGVIRFQKA